MCAVVPSYRIVYIHVPRTVPVHVTLRYTLERRNGIEDRERAKWRILKSVTLTVFTSSEMFQAPAIKSSRNATLRQLRGIPFWASRAPRHSALWALAAGTFSGATPSVSTPSSALVDPGHPIVEPVRHPFCSIPAVTVVASGGFQGSAAAGLWFSAMSLAHRNMPCHVQISQCPDSAGLPPRRIRAARHAAATRGQRREGEQSWPRQLASWWVVPCRLFPFAWEIR